MIMEGKIIIIIIVGYTHTYAGGSSAQHVLHCTINWKEISHVM